MPHPAIKVENLSKLYRIGTRSNHADTLRERLTHAIASPFRRLFGQNGQAGQEVLEWNVYATSFCGGGAFGAGDAAGE